MEKEVNQGLRAASVHSFSHSAVNAASEACMPVTDCDSLEITFYQDADQNHLDHHYSCESVRGTRKCEMMISI